MARNRLAPSAPGRHLSLVGRTLGVPAYRLPRAPSPHRRFRPGAGGCRAPALRTAPDVPRRPARIPVTRLSPARIHCTDAFAGFCYPS